MEEMLFEVSSVNDSIIWVIWLLLRSLELAHNLMVCSTKTRVMPVMALEIHSRKPEAARLVSAKDAP